MTKTTVVNIKKQFLKESGYRDLEHWLENPEHVYIGRNMSVWLKGATASKWKNPYSFKTFGKEECIAMYKDYLLNNKKLYSELSELKGKVLGCFCKPERCHGDIIVELLEEMNSDIINPH